MDCKLMALKIERKRELLTLLPESLPVTRQWLARQDTDFNRHAIDNLVKGASGQAVQNMNIMYGFNETEGLL